MGEELEGTKRNLRLRNLGKLRTRKLFVLVLLAVMLVGVGYGLYWSGAVDYWKTKVEVEKKLTIEMSSPFQKDE